MKALSVTADTRLRIVYRPLTELVPYARNARRHPPKQQAVIRASLLEYGWTNPMLIAEGQMIAGHGRMGEALKLAKEGVAIPRNPDPWEGPTIDLSHLTPPQRRAYVLMDNKSAELADWDIDMVAMELGDLKDDGIDLALAGFDEADVARLLNEDPLEPPGGDPDVDVGPAHECPRCGHKWTDGKS